ncbi:MaoC/PaaZ C-terminal domain-containing protein [Hydrogenophaga sp.]|uniref:MaoC/PaaZ C-terminal domain-containing protein n=1 Tax=Hydrogenophaga sp. TaxID=1904254 RepID=UPI00271AFD3C|nr:MaoC/PaaZ C-terminal domain-containing protein [Hydrogenophaga sp.]MDO9435952.1 MaoC/PaaZ C-terminal domain-containing protein [Hydrogenophaga sp.]
MIDPGYLLGLALPETRVTIQERDVMLYALGVGVGADPVDTAQLKFVYEKELQALPSIATVYPAMMSLKRAGNTGIDFTKLVHGSQGFRLHRPFPIKGELVGRATVTDLVDKGEEKGALVYMTGETFDAASGEHIATVTSMYFCRGDGGFGGKSESPAPEPLPPRDPDFSWDQKTPENLALIYRLSGDYNPLHADPEFARRARFERPILHGRATFGLAAHALLRVCCGYQPDRLVGMDARFTAPVYPGESMRTEIWNDGTAVRFRLSVPARGIVALDNGKAEIRS